MTNDIIELNTNLDANYSYTDETNNYGYFYHKIGNANLCIQFGTATATVTTSDTVYVKYPIQYNAGKRPIVIGTPFYIGTGYANSMLTVANPSTVGVTFIIGNASSQDLAGSECRFYWLAIGVMV